jgi:hypothetical protein
MSENSGTETLTQNIGSAKGAQRLPRMDFGILALAKIPFTRILLNVFNNLSLQPLAPCLIMGSQSGLTTDGGK